LNDEFGFTRTVGPLLGGLVRAFRPRRGSDSEEVFRLRGGSDRDRLPTDAQLRDLIQGGVLVLPPRYIIGFFLDLLI
jgi:hypothetical protein